MAEQQKEHEETLEAPRTPDEDETSLVPEKLREGEGPLEGSGSHETSGSNRKTMVAEELEPTPPPSDGEILFPLEEEEKKKERGPLGRVVRWFMIVLILGVIYLSGYATQPAVLKLWVDDIRGLMDSGVAKTKPLGESMYKKTVELVDKIHGPESSSGQPSKGGTSKEAGNRKIKYWKAPMTPGFTSDRPGKSPMGMDLIPVYEDDGGNGVSVNPLMIQNIGVKTEQAQSMAMRREIRTVARLTYDERMIHHIHTKYGGWIEKLYIDFTGQEVKKGDLLMDIYSPDLVSTQEELVIALKYNEALKESTFPEIRRGASRLLESTKRRLELFDVPQHQIDELISTKKINKTMHIHSPVKGFVVHKKAEHGMHVKPGKPLYTIANLSNIWVLADIYEYEVPWVKLGQEAEMTLAYFPGKTFKGKVTFISPFLDTESRTLKVRIEFANPNWELKPEMYANVTLKEETKEKGVAIPEEAVIYTGEKNIVIIQRPRGGFESREVSLGVVSQGFVQVLKGVKEGEEVVTSSSFLIDSESRLKEALGKLGGGAKPIHKMGNKKIILKEVPHELGNSKASMSKHNME